MLAHVRAPSSGPSILQQACLLSRMASDAAWHAHLHSGDVCTTNITPCSLGPYCLGSRLVGEEICPEG